MVDWLPEKYQGYVLLSPQVQIGELFRDGMYGNVIDTFWNVPYILFWCVTFWVIGLSMVKRARYAVAVSG
jgi:capsular polysaccharide transport system permease protein